MTSRGKNIKNNLFQRQNHYFYLLLHVLEGSCKVVTVILTLRLICLVRSLVLKTAKEQSESHGYSSEGKMEGLVLRV